MGIVKPFSLKQHIIKPNINPQKKAESIQDFNAYLKQLKETLRKEELLNKENDQLSLKALLGDTTAINYYMTKIDRYIREHPYNSSIPSGYSNLTEAIFHEWKGFGVAYHWFYDKKYANSSGLQIVGTNIFYKEKGRYKKYPYKLSDSSGVDHIKRLLLVHDETKSTSHSNPDEELKMNDPLWPERFIRIAIWTEPRVWSGSTTITLRRQIVSFLNFEEQAGTNSIDYEVIPIIRGLTYSELKTIISGPVDSGKTTFANTLVGELLERNPNYGVIMIEKHPESTLPLVFKNERIIPVVATEEELSDVGIKSLRHDPDVIYMTEMRMNEWEFFNFSSKKGYKCIVGTYHTKNSEDIPYQGALAIYNKNGGSLRAHLIATLEAVKIVHVFENQGDIKRLVRTSEIQYDKINQSVKSVDIIRFNKDEGRYNYYDGLSESLRAELLEKHPEQAASIFENLDRLSKLYPMSNPVTESEVSNQILRDGR